MQNEKLILLIPILAGVLYHIGQKTIKADVPAAMLFSVVYALGSLIMGLHYLSFNGTQSLSLHFSELPWIPLFLIMIGVAGIEVGYLLVYRAGIPVSYGALLGNMGQCLVLFLVGYFFYKETLSVRQLVGIVFAMISLYLLLESKKPI